VRQNYERRQERYLNNVGHLQVEEGHGSIVDISNRSSPRSVFFHAFFFKMRSTQTTPWDILLAILELSSISRDPLVVVLLSIPILLYHVSIFLFCISQGRQGEVLVVV
jgi:hypothetical protein